VSRVVELIVSKRRLSVTRLIAELLVLSKIQPKNTEILLEGSLRLKKDYNTGIHTDLIYFTELGEDTGWGFDYYPESPSKVRLLYKGNFIAEFWDDGTLAAAKQVLVDLVKSKGSTLHLNANNTPPSGYDKVELAAFPYIVGWDAVLVTYDPYSKYRHEVIGTYHGWRDDTIYIAGYNYYNPREGKTELSSTKFVSIGYNKFVVDLKDGTVTSQGTFILPNLQQRSSNYDILVIGKDDNKVYRAPAGDSVPVNRIIEAEREFRLVLDSPGLDAMFYVRSRSGFTVEFRGLGDGGFRGFRVPWSGEAVLGVRGAVFVDGDSMVFAGVVEVDAGDEYGDRSISRRIILKDRLGIEMRVGGFEKTYGWVIRP